MFIDNLKAIDPTELRLINHEAADILHNVVSAYDALFKRYQLARAENKPLYVVAGEYHDRPSHHIAHTLLIRCLSDITEKPIITALECPIDIKASDYPEALKNLSINKNALCPDSAANIELLKDYHTSEYAPYSSYSFEASLCHQQGRLITIFNDIAHNEDGSLNLTAILGPNTDEQPSTIAAKSNEGVALRNKFMSKQLMKYVEQHNTEIGIQICGQAHVNGSDTASPKQSIGRLLKDKGNMIFNIFWGAETALLTHLAPAEFYLSKNMPERFIHYQMHCNKDDFTPEELENYNLEKDYVQGIYQALNIKPPC